MEETKEFEKVVRLGVNDCGSVYCRILFKNGRLSITGVEGPTANGNARGGCGQINMSLKVAEFKSFAPGWDAAGVERFLAAWKRWHLNDMRAGSPAQENYLREHPVIAKYPDSHYEKASEALAAAGLNPDAEGYEYGHAWKKETVPAEVLAYFAGLPDTDKKPAWC